jgi:predicted transcriptional regulator
MGSRRIVLIDRPFQIRLAAEFVLLQALLTALFAAGVYVFTRSQLQEGLASAQAAYRSVADMLMPIVLVLAGFNILVSLVLVLGYVVHLTHRIARPLLRVRAALEELAQRRIYDHTGILPGDQLFELSESLRKALEGLRGDLRGLQETTAALRKAQAEGDAAGVEAHLRTLEASLTQWKA